MAAALRRVTVILCATTAVTASILDTVSKDVAPGHGRGSGGRGHYRQPPGPTATRTTSTVTTSTTVTTTSTTGPHVWGGPTTGEAFRGWMSIWRSKYEKGLWRAGVADPWESLLPEALRGIEPMVVASEGGVAQGVVSEGMGYGIMVEGLQAARGDQKALELGLALVKSWLGLVVGPGFPTAPVPYAGGATFNGSATNVDFWPYGVSAIEWSHLELGVSGVPAWKYPIDLCNKGGSQEGNCMGSATDGDQDAVLGMIYLAGALGYPDDFVDMVMRAVISFASADIGFPDLYRTLPNGERVFVPKLGSMWGGLLPEGGKYKTKQQPWCYSPGYFAPANYRTFRDFVVGHWKVGFDDYLPPHLDGLKSRQLELVNAFESTVTAGYNILHYSSCSSGSVSNWVGVKAPCADNDTLHCDGVPWAHTPYVGAEGGQCSQSGTKFGSYGADASRAAWRVAMDYALFREESAQVKMFDRAGLEDPGVRFGAQDYLNRIVVQYKTYSTCDGGVRHACMNSSSSPYQLAHAFDAKTYYAPNLNCSNVPNPPESWWSGFMSYPTFAAFIAPYDEIPADQMSQWMDTFASICNFSEVNMTDFESGGKPVGKICLTSYFEASQAVISTMIMSGSFGPVPDSPDKVVLKAQAYPALRERVAARVPRSGPGMAILGVGGALGMALLFSPVSALVSKLARGRPSMPRSVVQGRRQLYKDLQEVIDLPDSDDADDPRP